MSDWTKDVRRAPQPTNGFPKISRMRLYGAALRSTKHSGNTICRSLLERAVSVARLMCRTQELRAIHGGSSCYRSQVRSSATLHGTPRPKFSTGMTSPVITAITEVPRSTAASASSKTAAARVHAGSISAASEQNKINLCPEAQMSIELVTDWHSCEASLPARGHRLLGETRTSGMLDPRNV